MSADIVDVILKRSEESDTELRNRVKNILSIKVFFVVFGALTICSILIYCIVMTVLPKQYQFTEDRQLNANAEAFVSELSGMNYEDGIRAIYDFCIRNHSAAVLFDENRTLAFGEIRSGFLVEESPWDLKDSSHADTDGTAVQRIGTGGRQQKRVHSQSRSGAENGTYICRIHNMLQYGAAKSVMGMRFGMR